MCCTELEPPKKSLCSWWKRKTLYLQVTDTVIVRRDNEFNNRSIKYKKILATILTDEIIQYMEEGFIAYSQGKCKIVLRYNNNIRTVSEHRKGECHRT
jgi:hypothetical protein